MSLSSLRLLRGLRALRRLDCALASADADAAAALLPDLDLPELEVQRSNDCRAVPCLCGAPRAIARRAGEPALLAHLGSG